MGISQNSWSTPCKFTSGGPIELRFCQARKCGTKIGIEICMLPEFLEKSISRSPQASKQKLLLSLAQFTAISTPHRQQHIKYEWIFQLMKLVLRKICKTFRHTLMSQLWKVPLVKVPQRKFAGKLLVNDKVLRVVNKNAIAHAASSEISLHNKFFIIFKQDPLT